MSDALLKEIFSGCEVSTFITDRCLAMMNSIHKVFPDANQQLCIWHIQAAARKNFFKATKHAGVADTALEKFNEIVYAKTKEEAYEKLGEFDELYSAFENCYSEWTQRMDMWLAASTRTFVNFGKQSTQRVESINSLVKKSVTTRSMSVSKLFEKFDDFYSHQAIQRERITYDAQVRVRSLEHSELFDIYSSVTPYCFSLIEKEYKESSLIRIAHVGPGNISLKSYQLMYL